MGRIREIRKRDGRVVTYDRKKIGDAVFKAALAVGGEDRELADNLSGLVELFLEKEYQGDCPGIEDIQDMVEKVLMETGHARTAKAYILYRERRAELRRRAQVWKRTGQERDTTDVHLMVEGDAVEKTYSWDRTKIAEALVREAEVPVDVAEEIASVVEKRVFDSGLERISTGIVRELVDNELFNRRLAGKLERQAVVGMPMYDLESLIFSKSNENSNISVNNPEAINLTIAEHTLKQYALERIFSRDVADAHRSGFIHLHDLGYPVRVYCSSHSLEYIKKYGLHLSNLEVSSAPAKHASVLTGHLNTFLASMQAYYAGALGVAHINIMYAPLVEDMSDGEMRQVAQHLIFSSSQNAFSRGGQTLFLDFNIHSGIPGHLKDVPAVGSGGRPVRVEGDKDEFVREQVARGLARRGGPASGFREPDKEELAEIRKEENYVMSVSTTGDGTGPWVRTYGSYAEATARFARAMLDVWRAGDEHGHIFPFPKCDFHVSDETFRDRMQEEILDHACLVASENGVPYFIFDRDSVVLSACCRLRTRVRDRYMLKHPESLRFCGFQNVTVNLPQCAMRADRGDLAALRSEVESAMDLCMKAHVQKKKFIGRLMSSPAMPLWQLGQLGADDRPYVDLDKATYIIGIIGLNECMQHVLGAELHESEEVLWEGLKLIAHMFFKAKELGRRHGLNVSLEESPAESAARRLAKIDLARFPEARDLVRGDVDSGDVYYTNSVHLRPDAPVDLVTRIRMQAKFHSLIESGAITHAFVGEHRPSPGAIKSLVRKTHEKTQSAQLTISPEFTTCAVCHHMAPGLVDTCPKCGSRNSTVGYATGVEPGPDDRSVESYERLLERAGKG